MNDKINDSVFVTGLTTENEEPANLEAEMNTLGCGFLSKTALTKLCDDLTADMFYDERNSLIFTLKSKSGYSFFIISIISF